MLQGAGRRAPELLRADAAHRDRTDDAPHRRRHRSARRRVYPWYILCELTSAADEPLSELLQQTLADAAERSTAAGCGARNQRARARRLLAAAREHAGGAAPRGSEPQARYQRTGGLAAAVHRRGFALGAASTCTDGVLVCYGHAGDGNLHFNINCIDAASDRGVPGAGAADPPRDPRPGGTAITAASAPSTASAASSARSCSAMPRRWRWRDARHQAGARSERHHEPWQAALTCSRMMSASRCAPGPA